ncbi:hypothetical protein M413DRAFT_288621 [Hebeloma cylindrosporum]|uniref:Uncharacterized protein n=1 Tax=Hebeloma cylindrosporum TaxID=76867 RepID=A0A0C2Y674_HEBCY|nr:hypothetical protein M413DRAFT_288621 [Hebeloma cylindrosporum h7]
MEDGCGREGFRLFRVRFLFAATMVPHPERCSVVDWIRITRDRALTRTQCPNGDWIPRKDGQKMRTVVPAVCKYMGWMEGEVGFKSR